mmetsp:Transcript_5491/g.17366  ORF Transcript_5491/g.17366 Transcript_5491/m.17366 type:complete len:210 (+) Transcript_5491:1684-2313(+)
MRACGERGQPPRLPRVCQEIDHVVSTDQFVKRGHVVSSRFEALGVSREGVARHGNNHSDARVVRRGGYRRRRDLRQRQSRSGRLWLAAIFKGEKRLPGRVGVRHVGAVQKRDMPHAPGDEAASDGAAQGARADEQALGCSQRVQLQLRQEAPAHQLQVQLRRRRGQLGRRRQRRQVHGPRPEAALLVGLPARCADLVEGAQLDVDVHRE